MPFVPGYESTYFANTAWPHAHKHYPLDRIKPQPRHKTPLSGIVPKFATLRKSIPAVFLSSQFHNLLHISPRPRKTMIAVRVLLLAGLISSYVILAWKGDGTDTNFSLFRIWWSWV
jgi:hypothetical protein